MLDRAAIGCAINAFTLQVGSGPGRANSKLVAEFVASGKLLRPSTIAIPAKTTEKLLPSASLALSILAHDYVAAKNIVSFEMGWKNNIMLNEGFFPGSGFQTGGDATTGAIRGRLEHGERELMAKFVARFVNGSPELTALNSQTSGTLVASLTYDANNSLTITFQKVTYRTTKLDNTNGLVTVAVDVIPLVHATDGLLSVVAKCNLDGIAQ